MGYRNCGLRRKKALISLKCGKIALLLLLMTMKSYTRFRLVPNSTTLDDLEGSLWTVFQNTCVMHVVVVVVIYLFKFIFSFTFSLL